jgi:hypothetical protein
MFPGTEIVVRNRYSLRSIRLSGTRRRGVFTSDADGAEFREGQRDLLQIGYNIQAAAEVPAELGGNVLFVFGTAMMHANAPAVLPLHRLGSARPSD